MTNLQQNTLHGERGDIRAVVGMVYVFCLAIIIGNLVMFQQKIVILPINSDQKLEIGIKYESTELRWIRSMCNKDPNLKMLPTSTMMRARSLKIQRRRKRGSHGRLIDSLTLLSDGVNKNNLISVKCQPIHPSKNVLNFHLGCGNLRSVKNKVDLSHDHILGKNYDAFIVAETWLQNTERDNTWIQCSGLNFGTYEIHIQ